MNESVASALFGLVPDPMMAGGDFWAGDPALRRELLGERRAHRYTEEDGVARLAEDQFDGPQSAMVASAVTSRITTRAPSMLMTFSSLRRRS